MTPITLISSAADGQPLQATFLPDKGMSLISYRKGGLDVLDPATRLDFETYGAGLGCLIGPHFYLQKEEWIQPIKDPSLFPHLLFTEKKGYKDPFSHGIGRYAPWKYEATERTISAKLCGKDIWKGTALSELEGADFTLRVDAELTPQGLNIALHASSTRVCVIGLHYYYLLPPGKAQVTALVKDVYNNKGKFMPIEKRWIKKGSNHLMFDLREFADYGFLPLKEDHSGEVQLETSTYKLRICYQGASEEVSWQLYHPENATFVCIEPISAKNPRGLTASSSSLTTRIEIL